MKVGLIIGCYAALVIGCLPVKVDAPIKADVPIEATGVHVGDKTEAPTTAGRDVWNISFGDVLGKAGWLLLPSVGAGWWMSKKKTTRALDTVIESIEQKQCVGCKRCIEAKGNLTVNKRAAVVSAKMKNGGQPPCH